MDVLRLGRQKIKGVAAAVALAFVIAVGVWQLAVGPAIVRAQEWNGTIVEMEERKSLFNFDLTKSARPRDKRRLSYIWVVNYGDEKREIEVTERLFRKASTGQQAVKVKGDRWPSLR